MKNLPVHDINLNKLITNYFNLYFNNNILLSKYLSPLRKRLSINRIFVSRPEIKHTNSKVIITIYSYNRQRIALLNRIKLKIKKVLLLFFIFLNFTNYTNKVTKVFNKKIIKQSNLDLFKPIYNKILKNLLYKDLLYIRKQKLKLELNKFKFKEKFLYKLSILVSKFYGKKVVFNIINIKNIILNSDIFTEILTLKLRKDRAKVVGMMNKILAKTKISPSNTNKIQKKFRLAKSINFNLLANKYKNLSLNSIINKKKNLDLILKENYEEIIFNNNYFSKKDVIKHNLLNEIIFNNIKYKILGGIKLEVKGRLTKRYRADRAISKVKLKGGLQNIDSSFEGLSGVNFRGYLNSNVEYSIRSSKRRIGAFAVKG